MIAVVSVYARRTNEFSGAEINALLGLATVFAVSGAVLSGGVMARHGSKRVLEVTLIGAAVALLFVGLSGASWTLWVGAPVVGAAIGSVAATDRVYLLCLIEPERRGEGFGLYALVGRVSNGFGALVLWGGTVALFSEVLAVASLYAASRIAVCVLALAAVGGMLVLRPLPDRRVMPPASVAA